MGILEKDERFEYANLQSNGSKSRSQGLPGVTEEVPSKFVEVLWEVYSVPNTFGEAEWQNYWRRFSWGAFWSLMRSF